MQLSKVLFFGLSNSIDFFFSHEPKVGAPPTLAPHETFPLGLADVCWSKIEYMS